MLINSSGSPVARYLYDPYGNTLGMWGTLAPVNTYRFSSKEMDLNSGLYYFGFRYYEPNFQRWLNRDPIGENGGINLYDYVGNDPIDNFDPFGLVGLPWRQGGAQQYYNAHPVYPEYDVPNPTGHGVIIFDSSVSAFGLVGGGGGTQTVLLDNGQVVSYGYFMVGTGLGAKICPRGVSAAAAGKGGGFGMGEVYGVYTPLDYAGPFVSVSAGLVAGASVSSYPGGSASYTVGATGTGLTGTVQNYWIISASYPIGNK